MKFRTRWPVTQADIDWAKAHKEKCDRMRNHVNRYVTENSYAGFLVERILDKALAWAGVQYRWLVDKDPLGPVDFVLFDKYRVDVKGHSVAKKTVSREWSHVMLSDYMIPKFEEYDLWRIVWGGWCRYGNYVELLGCATPESLKLQSYEHHDKDEIVRGIARMQEAGYDFPAARLDEIGPTLEAAGPHTGRLF